jgi:serine/threonine-protein kinase
MPLSVGETFDGRYVILALLAQGGMADVYRACDTETDQQVVLKLPQPATAGDLAMFNRYRREIEIGEHLDHPGIQRLLSAPRSPYIVLEYVDGENLRSYLRARGQLSVEEVLRIGVQLTEVLEYVHSQGIVHRDLKPENILIQPDGSVRLMDFGIALRLASRRLTFNHLTNAIGTPDYMAPEQVRGERGDTRTDVYAVGVLLFELLTGRVPYPAHDALEAMRRKVETEPPLVRRLRPEVPEALQAIVYRALRRRPEERYSSMAEVQHDLKHLDSVLIPAYVPDVPPPTPPGDLPPWRTTIRILAAIVGILALLGFLAQTLHQFTPPR